MIERMDAQKFAAGYPISLPAAVVHKGWEQADITEAQDWSYAFGRFLHARLNGTAPDALKDMDTFRQYRDWTHGFSALEQKLFDNPEHGLRARNEINFHGMNRLMLGMWEPIGNGRWATELNRTKWLQIAQDSLAMEGLAFYIARERYIRRVGSHVLFDQGKDEELHRCTTGVLQEIDAAIILLDIMRRNPTLSIVPAPLQFERSSSRRRNVDFVVMDFVDKRAVGVQVKSLVQQRDYDNADQERVVFIDGTVDLGNVRAVRTQKARSTERIIPWAGIIAAKRVDSIKTHGSGSRPQFAQNSRDVMQLKMEARHLVGNMNVDHREISARIGERILNKL